MTTATYYALIFLIFTILGSGSIQALDYSVDTDLDAQINAPEERNRNAVSIDLNGDLTIDADGNIVLSNGTTVEVITGAQAQTIARTYSGGTCESECHVEVEEERENGRTQVVYEVETHKKAKLFGVFNTSITMTTEIDAQTGAVIESEKSWWAFLATESTVNS